MITELNFPKNECFSGGVLLSDMGLSGKAGREQMHSCAFCVTGTAAGLRILTIFNLTTARSQGADLVTLFSLLHRISL